MGLCEMNILDLRVTEKNTRGEGRSQGRYVLTRDVTNHGIGLIIESLKQKGVDILLLSSL